MSAGNQVYTLRLDKATTAAISAAVDSRNKITRRAPWTFSDFIRQAVLDKLDHISRSKRAHNNRSKLKPDKPKMETLEDQVQYPYLRQPTVEEMPCSPSENTTADATKPPPSSPTN